MSYRLFKCFAVSFDLATAFKICGQLFATSLIMLIISGCTGGKMEENKAPFVAIRDVPKTAWERLSAKRIFFGHQSVGYNMIEGMTELMKTNPQIGLNIVRTSDPARFNVPLFAHSEVGQNGDPVSKIEDFSKFMEKGLGNKIDIAFLKFCYVDITATTDVEKLFRDYRVSRTALEMKYPRTTFIHITTPLTSPPVGLKGQVKFIIKKIIGRPTASIEDNINRSLFNDKMRKEYEGKEPLFDLARIESTSSDGTQALFEKDGKTYPHLVEAYTHDGGHLNEKGRKIVAEQILVFLANLSH
jgi:hypothetical protein